MRPAGLPDGGIGAKIRHRRIAYASLFCSPEARLPAHPPDRPRAFFLPSVAGGAALALLVIRSLGRGAGQKLQGASPLFDRLVQKLKAIRHDDAENR